jgi:hypothetical protein
MNLQIRGIYPLMTKTKRLLRAVIIPVTTIIGMMFLGGSSVNAQVCGGGASNNCWTVSPIDGLASTDKNALPPATPTLTKDYTITFTWTTSDGTPAPSSVVLKKTKSGGSYNGNVTRSFSTVPVYEVKTGVGASFQVKSGSMTVTNSTPTPHLTLGYLVQIANPVISLTGTTKNAGENKILIGQGCSANMSLAGNIPDVMLDTSNNYDVRPDGQYFDHYEVDSVVNSASNMTGASTGKVVSCFEYDILGDRFTAPNPRRWIWSTPGSAKITGSANVKISSTGASVGTVTETKAITIEEPLAISMNAYPTNGGIYKTASTVNGVFTYRFASGIWDQGGVTLPGMEFRSRATTQPIYISTGGAGRITYVQLTTRNRTWSYDNAPTQSESSPKGLDNSFPYSVVDFPSATQPNTRYYNPETYSYSANNSLALTSDSPWHQIDGAISATSSNDSFEMYLMYLPPKKDSMDNDWVPLRRTIWTWIGSATRPAAGWNSYTGTASTVSGQNGAPYRIHPTWTSIVVNSIF